MARLLLAWRQTNRPVIHIQHLSTNPESPLRPGQPGCAFKPEAEPRAGERVFQKRVNSAFIGTGLESYLRDAGIDTLVMIGLTTDHCVSTSVRMAGNLGFRTYVVADATAAFACGDHEGRAFDADVVHAVSLATLHREFATVVRTDNLISATGIL
jgi:nicotinamidase-related amidase